MSAPTELYERVENDFSFHPANMISQPLHEEVRLRFKQHAFGMLELTNPGREQSLMLTALEEAMFWANASVARSQPTE